MMGLMEQLQRYTAPIYRRMAVILSKGIVKSVSDTTAMPLIKVSLSKDELREGLEHIQSYGFTSVPEAGAEALIGFFGGVRDNGVVILIGDSRERKKGLAAGDVCMYRKGGPFIHLKANNEMEIHGKNINVTLESGGKLNVGNGNLTVDA